MKIENKFIKVEIFFALLMEFLTEKHRWYFQLKISFKSLDQKGDWLIKKISISSGK